MPDVNILALQGSPRRGGNTDRLLAEVLESARKRGAASKTIVIRDHKISPCLEINACMSTGHCAIQDDMTAIYDEILSARVVILATPIFFYGPSALAKALIDRCQALWARKYMLKQMPSGPKGQGYLVSPAATRGKKLFDGLLLTTRYFFDVLHLDFAGQLLVRGVDEKGDVDKQPEALAEARAMGEKIADYILEIG